MNRKLIAAAVVGVLMVGSAVYAAPGGEGRGRGQQGPDRERGPRGGHHGIGMLLRNPKAAEAAGLSEDQISALEASVYENRKQMIQLHANLQIAELEVEHLEDQDAVNVVALTSAIEKAGNVAIEIEKTQATHRIQMQEIIGEEGMAKLREFGQAMRAERRDGEGRGNRDGRRQKGGKGERGQRQRAMDGSGRGGNCPMMGADDADDADDDAGEE